ncbi:16932_t:CDS:2, partial [Funneliformis caledonium]
FENIGTYRTKFYQLVIDRYPDGTILMLDEAKDTDRTYGNSSIFVNSVRLLHPNKTINYLYAFTKLCPYINQNCFIKTIIPFKANHVLMIYINELSQYNVVISDWSDKVILQDTSIKLSNFEIGTPQIIQNNFYDEYRSLFLVSEGNNLFYKEYNYKQDDGQFVIYQEGNITFEPNLIVYTDISFSTKEGYGIISYVHDRNYFNGVNPTYLTLIQTELNANKMSHLNLTKVTSTFIRKTTCKADLKINYKYSCLILSIDQQFILAEIDYLTSINDFEVKTKNLTIYIDYDSALIEFPASGVDFMIFFYLRASKSINVVLFNANVNDFITSEFYGGSLNFYSHSGGARRILHDKELIIAADIDEHTWNLQSINISQFIPETNMLNNLHIKKTWPLWNESIYIDTNMINITFVHPIELTNKEVYASIYLYNDGEYMLRQRFKCISPECTLSKDRYSLNMTIKETTFSIPEMVYHIEIGDEFAEFRNINQLLPGIKKEDWPIRILSNELEPKPKSKLSDQTPEFTIGSIRLNVMGTNHFKKLNDVEKENFIEQMRIEISKSIPVDGQRITYLKHFAKYKENALFIAFKIHPPNENNFNKKSSKDVFMDFVKLLEVNDFTTALDIYNNTRFIDKKFGFEPTSNRWEEIKMIVQSYFDPITIGLIVSLAFLLTNLYFFGRYKNRMGCNAIVFKAALIILDIVNDISFIVTNEEYLQKLLIPSIVFIICPILINTCLAFYIFIFETRKNPKFADWFRENSKLAAIITLFSSGNIELLHLIDSNYAGYKLFSAPFSSKALCWIFWGGFSNILIEDLPQLIIQIIYVASCKKGYNIFALSALVTGFVILLIDVIGFIYDFIAKRQNMY